MPIDITILIAVVGGVVGVSTFLVGRFAQAKSSGKEDGALRADIGYLKKGVDDIMVELRDQRKMNAEVLGRLVAVEKRTEFAHKRIDKLEERHG